MSQNMPADSKSGRTGRNNNPYIRLGVVLAVSGAITAPVFYFIVGSVPLTALSLSAVILGLVSAMLGNARPDISPEASRMMLETGMENIAALLEELGLTTRAVYLPSAHDGDRPKALIPLKDDDKLPEINRAVPKRLIARYGPNLENMGLMVITPGAVSLDGVSLIRGGGPEQLENALNQILVGQTDLVDSVSLHVLENGLLVDVSGPKLKYENVWYYRCLGSPLASIAAAVSAQAMAKPVRVKSEMDMGKNRIRVELELLP